MRYYNNPYLLLLYSTQLLFYHLAGIDFPRIGSESNKICTALKMAQVNPVLNQLSIHYFDSQYIEQLKIYHGII